MNHPSQHTTPNPPVTFGPELVARLTAHLSPELLRWFINHGLCRVAIEGNEAGEVTEMVAPPVLLLGPGEADIFACPDPDFTGEPPNTLATMTLDDYHLFLLRWFTRAVEADRCRCVVCGRAITTDPTAPWDGIFVDKELVGWLIIHFDCKRGLARAILGRTAFDMVPLAPEMGDAGEHGSRA